MYIRKVFEETDLDRLHDLIEAYNFGMLVINDEPAPFVSHLPFALDRSKGPNGTLHVHMARANPQWQHLNGQALAVFRGPHAYISPTWYEPGQNAVPTWNYAVVHAYGTPRIVEDPQAVRAQQEHLVVVHESGRSPVWQMADQPAEYIDGMLGGIVAFEIPIEQIIGKFKLSQDRSAIDRRNIAAALVTEDTADGPALARLMTEE